MLTTHVLGLPRIGKGRALKFALEDYWKRNKSEHDLLQITQQLEQTNWQRQHALSWLTVGDFSLYDHVLDHSLLFGNMPARAYVGAQTDLEVYFNVARGNTVSDVGTSDVDSFHVSNSDANNCCGHTALAAAEMTKWFDTNYHYLVPELSADTVFSLNSTHLVDKIKRAKHYLAQHDKQGAKLVLLGPITYLWLAKSVDESSKLQHLPALLQCYAALLDIAAQQNIPWLQVDEPILATDLSQEWWQAIYTVYHQLKHPSVRILLTSYFGDWGTRLRDVLELPVAGFHIDAVRGKHQLQQVVDWIPHHKVLSVGVIDGRNIWKTDLHAWVTALTPIYHKLKDKLWLATSCSLLHVPDDLNEETRLPAQIKDGLAFAEQKLHELTVLAYAVFYKGEGLDFPEWIDHALSANVHSIQARCTWQTSSALHLTEDAITQMSTRDMPYNKRIELQRQRFNLPLFPTTTIGSFPQTQDIRLLRQHYKTHKISDLEYQHAMQSHIAYAIEVQETLGLDVLVHGEPERNDMVEYFAEHLSGFCVTEQGWVQSYGSRCVKPPILYGAISRPYAITTAWATYAQSLTQKPVKGMLTGPVTILNWSFVREDQPRAVTCLELAFVLRQEVLDLEKEGIGIIQIDEAALREGLPLKEAERAAYLAWAVQCFKVASSGVHAQTQIHTHMCYSDFNDIMDAIVAMDADVITIETARSHMALLEAFKHQRYPNDMGPGVYDIHSPHVPSTQQMVQLMEQALCYLPAHRVWVNPDCGLKTRAWDEVIAALRNMVAVAQQLRQHYDMAV